MSDCKRCGGRGYREDSTLTDAIGGEFITITLCCDITAYSNRVKEVLSLDGKPVDEESSSDRGPGDVVSFKRGEKSDRSPAH
jgi:hypothetical protein